MALLGLNPCNTQAEIMRFDHAGNDKQIDEPSYNEQPAGAKPDDSRDGFTAIKSMYA